MGFADRHEVEDPTVPGGHSGADPPAIHPNYVGVSTSVVAFVLTARRPM
jgi:hypothetical protein